MAPDRHPRCPGAPPAKVRGHPTPIAPATGGERFSPTRFSLTGADPAAETTRRGLCAAPPSEKRYTLSIKKHYATREMKQYQRFAKRRRLLPLVPVTQWVDIVALSSAPLRLPVLIIPF